ncbi:carboxypeptidase-like regulatory domain-containing protein [Azoarcus olearius]|uniref:Conserved hypothetical membrane protein n=1 Tax=Azoarcus sp. (strain BH72) TaxID=418699 RepID=A1K7N1_AZOSB|nr:carboxypeptidase-like regulatory domain-containing protein [Azoarcus olearius]CAL94836.1 conserved hypothetical membrane protein [Azoarcus olearius]
MKLTPAPLLLALALGAASAAHAHGLTLTAQGEGAQLVGRVAYTDDTPAAGIYVSASLAQGDGTMVTEGNSDAEGRFRLPAPAGKRLRVVAEGEEGHRVEVIAEPLAPAGDEASVAALGLLREDIARLEHRLRMQDIIGGIGYIVGLAGIAAWVSARRRG